MEDNLTSNCLLLLNHIGETMPRILKENTGSLVSEVLCQNSRGYILHFDIFTDVKKVK